MSFYRTFIAAVAAMGLATAVLADDTTTTTTTQTSGNATVSQASDSTNAEQSKINLNTATAKELQKVKGVNSSKAKAIVSYRKKHGEFKSLDDLKQVAGFKKMNEQTLKDIQDQLTIG